MKGLSWWWYIVAAGLVTAAFSLQEIENMALLLSLTWIWPLLVWSNMGCREFSFGTEEIVFSTPRVLCRQLTAIWVAGFAVAAVTAGGVILRLATAGHWEQLLNIIIGAAFITSLALSLGVFSKGSKLFEVVYVAFFWYFGLMNGVPYLDFIGLSGQALAPVSPLFHLTAALILFAAAMLSRIFSKGGA